MIRGHILHSHFQDWVTALKSGLMIYSGRLWLKANMAEKSSYLHFRKIVFKIACNQKQVFFDILNKYIYIYIWVMMTTCLFI